MDINAGMVERQYRWELVNLYLYEQLQACFEEETMNVILDALIGKQKKQLHYLATYFAINLEHENSKIYSFECKESIQESIKELYEREYQLLQEYLSYDVYYFKNNRLSNKLNQLINDQTEQVNTLIELKKIVQNKQNQNQLNQSYMIEEGYKFEKVVADLSFPTSIAFDQEGAIYIAESGFVYGRPPKDGRVIKVDKSSQQSEIVNGLPGPVTGMVYYQEALFISVGNRSGSANPGCGKIIKIEKDGKMTTVAADLKTCGDHFTGDIVVGNDQRLYFGVGTATNSGVVGKDNLSWLKFNPEFHDTPARTFKLSVENFVSENPLNKEKEILQTGAFMPLGTPSKKGELVEGKKLSNGVIYRCHLDGSHLEIFADGFRNPFGLQFSPFNGKLYTTDNGADPRGSRRIFNDWDSLWQVEVGRWHGWPDFFSGLPVTLPHFHQRGQVKPTFLIENHPSLSEKLVTRFEPHSSSNKFDFSTNPQFGYVGEIFVAQSGGLGFEGESKKPGFKVVRINEQTGQVNDFYKNLNGENILNAPVRPVEAKFSPKGEVLYLIDLGYIGKMNSAMPKPNSGAIWKIVKEQF